MQISSDNRLERVDGNSGVGRRVVGVVVTDRGVEERRLQRIGDVVQHRRGDFPTSGGLPIFQVHARGLTLRKTAH